MAYSDEASSKQIDLIKRLFNDLGPKMDAADGTPEAEQVTTSVTGVQETLVKVMAGHPVTKGEVSPAIDVLIAADKLLSKVAARKLTPGIVNADRIIANKFAKDCTFCGENVEAGEGYAAQIVGRWETVCAQCAAEAPEVRSERLAARPAPEVPKRTQDPEVGVYVNPENGTLVRVYIGRQSGRLNGKINTGGGWVWTGRKDFAVCTPENRITAEQAAAYGHKNSECVFCGISLEDSRSTEVGYGPTCAENNGLPWGVKKSEPIVLDSPVGPGALTPTGFAGRPDFRPSAVVVL